MSFWSVFVLMLIWIPILTVWVFTVMDVFRRRDLKGWARAGWFLVVLFLPILGTVIYLVARPGEPDEVPARKRPDPAGAGDVELLERLTALRDAGSISDEDFSKLKARVVQQ